MKSKFVNVRIYHINKTIFFYMEIHAMRYKLAVVLLLFKNRININIWAYILTSFLNKTFILIVDHAK